MRFAVRGGLGDEVALTAVVRAYREAHPQESIFVDTSAIQQQLFVGNPHAGPRSHNNGQLYCFNTVTAAADPHLNLPGGLARQIGLRLIDPTPQVFLTEGEELSGRDRVVQAAVRAHKPESRVIAMDVWALDPARRWPFERYAALSEWLMKDGATVIEVGRRVGDIAGAFQVQRIPRDASYWDQLTVRETAAVLAACDFYIGNDSGLLHLAAAVGTPQVLIMWGYGWHTRAYWNSTSVYPIGECKCGVHQDRFCLKGVTLEQVKDAVKLAFQRFP